MSVQRIVFLLVIILAIGGIFWFLNPKPKELPVDTATLPETFGEMATYVNKQADFSIQYPNSWTLTPKELDDETTRGVRIAGRQGYLELYWGQDHEKGGCSQKETQLQLNSETISVCNFKQKDGSEIWNQIVKDRGEIDFWANAYAASPSAQTRQAIVAIFSTLSFTN